MKRVAGLLVLSRDADGPFALLQRRGDWDYERNQRESFPGGCQATASGGMEPEDADAFDAMSRETRQELGDAFADLVLAAPPAPLSTWSSEERKRHATFFVATVPEEWLPQIRLHPSSGGLVRIRQNTKIADLFWRSSRDAGIANRYVIAAFEEVIQAVETAFRLME